MAQLGKCPIFFSQKSLSTLIHLHTVQVYMYNCTWLSLYFCVATVLFKYFFVYLIMLYCKCGYLFEKLLDYTKSGDKHINIKKIWHNLQMPNFYLKNSLHPNMHGPAVGLLVGCFMARVWAWNRWNDDHFSFFLEVFLVLKKPQQALRNILNWWAQGEHQLS